MEASYIIPHKNKIYGLGTAGSFLPIFLFSSTKHCEDFLTSAILFIKDFRIKSLGVSDFNSMFNHKRDIRYPYLNPQVTVALLKEHFIVGVLNEPEPQGVEEYDE